MKRTVFIHQSLHRPDHFLGAERIPIAMAALFALLVGIGGQSLYTALPAGLFWIGTAYFLRKMAQKDPIFSKVFLRYVKYNAFYPAKSTSWKKK